MSWRWCFSPFATHTRTHTHTRNWPAGNSIGNITHPAAERAHTITQRSRRIVHNRILVTRLHPSHLSTITEVACFVLISVRFHSLLPIATQLLLQRLLPLIAPRRQHNNHFTTYFCFQCSQCSLHRGGNRNDPAQHNTTFACGVGGPDWARNGSARPCWLDGSWTGKQQLKKKRHYTYTRTAGAHGGAVIYSPLGVKRNDCTLLGSVYQWGVAGTAVLIETEKNNE